MFPCVGCVMYIHSIHVDYVVCRYLCIWCVCVCVCVFTCVCVVCVFVCICVRRRG